MSPIQQNRGTELLETLRPELLKLFSDAPDFGSIGLEVIFHAGSITRTVTKTEVQRKNPGGEHAGK